MRKFIGHKVKKSSYVQRLWMQVQQYNDSELKLWKSAVNLFMDIHRIKVNSNPIHRQEAPIIIFSSAVTILVAIEEGKIAQSSFDNSNLSREFGLLENEIYSPLESINVKFKMRLEDPQETFEHMQQRSR